MKVPVSGSLIGFSETLSSELFSRSTLKRLTAGDALFEAGDKGDGCYRLDKGFLKVVLRSRHGEERILSILTPGSVVGDLSMIDDLPRSASVVAISDCELYFVSREAFRKCTETYPAIHEHLTRLLARRLRQTDETVAALAFLTWKGRVARALLEIAESLGKTSKSGEIVINDMISHRELAGMAGVARENVSRAFGEWKRSKIVSRSDHSLHIHKKSELEREMES